MHKLEAIEKEQLKGKITDFRVGDTVEVHVKIKEGDKERVQVFKGTVIARRGSGTRESFTVRRIVAGEGVERTFPLHSPVVTKIKVTRGGKVRQAKIYYVRNLAERAARIQERRD